MDGRIVADALLLVAAYLIGGIPSGVILARVVGGPDPRSVGSGRTGGANVARALGPRVAILTGALDVLKGAVAVVLARLVGGGLDVQVLAALAAIVGHSRSPFIGLRGGRGVSPAYGGLLVIEPAIAVLMVPVFLVVFAVSRYSSLASLTASAFAGVVVAGVGVITGQPVLYAYALGGAGLIWLFHHDNIARLLAGTERRFGSPRPNRADPGAR